MIEILSSSVEQTVGLGAALGGVAREGDVIGLIGELGAGKTQLARGIAQGLGIDPRQVASPTFVLMTEYMGRMSLVHIDAYRMDGLSDLVSTGWGADLARQSVTVIEWADRLGDEMAKDRLDVRMRHRDEQHREMRITPHGIWVHRVDEVRAALEKVVPSVKRTHGSTCPICHKPTTVEMGTYPFCSNRCRLIDLNGWMSGEYSLSRPIEEDDMEDAI